MKEIRPIELAIIGRVNVQRVTGWTLLAVGWSIIDMIFPHHFWSKENFWLLIAIGIVMAASGILESARKDAWPWNKEEAK